MKKHGFYFIIFTCVVFLVIVFVVPAGAEITPDQYVFINKYVKIEGESDQPFMFVDFPMYRYYKDSGTLESLAFIDVTDQTKVILGTGFGLGGSVGSGASTNLYLYDTLSEPDLFTIDAGENVQFYNETEWITLTPGQTWTRTFETTSYRGFSGNLVVTETIINFGAWGKSDIIVPNSTPIPTPGPGNILGDVNDDGSVDIIDALLTAQDYVGLDPEGFNPGAADVNCDGSVDIIDALLIAQYYVGLVSEFC